MDKLFCISKTTIQIDRTDHRLHRIGDNRRTFSSSGQVLALSEQQIIT